MGGAWSNVPGVSAGLVGGIELEEVLVAIRVSAAKEAAHRVPNSNMSVLRRAYLVNKYFQTLKPESFLPGFTTGADAA